MIYSHPLKSIEIAEFFYQLPVRLESGFQMGQVNDLRRTAQTQSQEGDQGVALEVGQDVGGLSELENQILPVVADGQNIPMFFWLIKKTSYEFPIIIEFCADIESHNFYIIHFEYHI